MANFSVDGIVIKVAEKYRVPPRIAIPEEVVQLVCGDHYKRLLADTKVEYDFNLERNVIQKIDEWQRVHDQSEHVRQEQLRARDRERRQNQEKEQKHLLNQVSYPSTDDLSLSSDNENTGEDDSRSVDPQQQQQSNLSTNQPPNLGGGSNGKAPHPLSQDFSCILQPTIVPEPNIGIVESNKAMSTWSAALKNSSGGLMSGGNGLTNTAINYSEWESDNYSPFDRMELKSMNDLDILAQVLHTTQLANNAEKAEQNKALCEEELPKSPPQITSPEACVSPPPAQVKSPPSPPPVVPTVTNSTQFTESYSNPWQYHNHQPVNAPTQSQAHPSTFLTYQEQPTTASATAASQSHMDYNSPGSNGSYYPNHQNQQQSNNARSYLPQQPIHQYPATVYQQYATNHYQYPPPSAGQTQYSTQFSGMTTTAELDRKLDSESSPSSQSLMRSKSKSVPDIMHELEEEVKASEQRRRTRNHSQCAKTAAEEEEAADNDSSSPDDSKTDPLERLTTTESRDLAIKISKMGFSLHVVATVIEHLGNDDKKVSGPR